MRERERVRADFTSACSTPWQSSFSKIFLSYHFPPFCNLIITRHSEQRLCTCPLKLRGVFYTRNKDMINFSLFQSNTILNKTSCWLHVLPCLCTVLTKWHLAMTKWIIISLEILKGSASARMGFQITWGALREDVFRVFPNVYAKDLIMWQNT